MAEVKLNLDLSGLMEATRPAVSSTTERISSRAEAYGAGHYEARVDTHRDGRPHGSVHTANMTARRDNAANNTLLSALGGA